MVRNEPQSEINMPIDIKPKKAGSSSVTKMTTYAQDMMKNEPPEYHEEYNKEYPDI